MPRKPKLPPDDAEQSKRFIEAARELGTDETGKAFERAFEKVMVSKPDASTIRNRGIGRKTPHKSTRCE